jgi:CTP synthase (UTP-ammonia lyase)
LRILKLHLQNGKPNTRCKMKLAIIGDFNPSSRTHVATNEAIEHAKKYLNLELAADWISTDLVIDNLTSILKDYHGFWIAPGSPYKSMTGALEIIKHARLNNIPTFGTCGGFQHMAIEFARNVLNIKDAEHAEYDPYASNLVVTPLSCSLVGKKLKINLTDKKSLTYKTFNSDTIEEKYYCNFGLNPEYEAEINKNGLAIVGIDANNEARILELKGHRFFIATLFVPQDNSTFENPHKLVLEFISVVACKTYEVSKTS